MTAFRARGGRPCSGRGGRMTARAAKGAGWLRSYMALLLPDAVKDKYGPAGFMASWEAAKASLEASYRLYYDKAAERTRVLSELAALRCHAEAAAAAVGAELGLSAEEAWGIGEKLYAFKQEEG